MLIQVCWSRICVRAAVHFREALRMWSVLLILLRWLLLGHKMTCHMLVAILLVNLIQETGRLNECLVGKHLFFDIFPAL